MTDAAALTISDDLAGRVVRTIAPTLSHNVNIMDGHGVIIAALQAERIGHQHRGALEVLARGEEVLIVSPDPESTDRVGANVPLIVRGSLVGVVGVTGDPVQVAPIARVVAVTVGLLVEQELESDRALAGQTAAREAITLLSSPTATPAEAGRALASVGLHLPVQIGVRIADPARPTRRALADGVSASVHGGVWHLLPADASRIRTDAAWFVASSLPELLARCSELRALLRRPALLPRPDDATWDAEIAVAVAGLPARSLERLAETAERMTDEHTRTVTALWRHRSLQATADALPVHRNTLLQRVERIAALTGHDPRVPADLARLVLAITARRAHPASREI